MKRYNGAVFLSSQHVVPNVTLRLLQRELAGHPCGAGVHTARAFSESILPTHKILSVEAPNIHIGKFLADGNTLVAFSLQLDAVVLLDYLGPLPQRSSAAASAATQPHDWNQPGPIGFHNFFKERYRLPLCYNADQLCRDFVVSLHQGRFLLLASSTHQQPRPEAAAADAAAVAEDRSGQHQAGLRHHHQQQEQQQQQHQQQGQLPPDVGPPEDAPAPAAGGWTAASIDFCDLTTFHVIDVTRCVKVDQRQYTHDYFDLSGNACASLHEDILALTSIRTQTIHMLQVSSSGRLTDMQSVGRLCLPDDEAPVEVAAAAEHRWQVQKLHERQQQQYWMHHQARALLPAHRCPAAAAATRGYQQQQEHAQPASATALQGSTARLPVTNNSVTRRIRRRAGSTSTSSTTSSTGTDDPTLDTADSVDSSGSQTDSMEEHIGRRVRPRLATAAGAATATHHHHQNHHHHQQQQSAIRSRTVSQQGGGQQQQGVQPLGDGGTAAAAAATSAALLDPGGQLITGLRQRLLTYLYKAVVDKQACDVAPTFRDFQHNFAVLSTLVVWRARLLGRHQLLLKVGAPTSGPAAAADANPLRVHFFGVYDLKQTRFVRLWRSTSYALLSEIIEQPCKLLAASQDLTSWERCTAGALYPRGHAVGLEQAPPQPTQPPPPAAATTQQQQQHNTWNTTSTTSHHHAAQSAAPPATAAATATPNPPASSAGGAPPGSGSSISSQKAAKDRLKCLRQVVLMVLPALQSLSPSPYLDPHLFRYSKHLSPIIGLRNSPTQPIRFQLTRQYPGFTPHIQQQHIDVRTGQPVDDAAGGGARGPSGCDMSAQHQAHSTHPGQQQARAQQQVHAQDVLQLDVRVLTNLAGEEVQCRQLHLFHPFDPFVLGIVSAPGPAVLLNIYFRM